MAEIAVAVASIESLQQVRLLVASVNLAAVMAGSAVAELAAELRKKPEQR
jgi:hypothetical protein